MKPTNILSTLALGMALTSAAPVMAQTDADKVILYAQDGSVIDEYSCTDIIRISHDQNKTNVFTNTFGEDIPMEYDNSQISRVEFKFADDDNVKVNISDIQLADRNASDATKILYAYLKYYYGNKIVTASMANVNWNTSCADHAYKQTGTYPAINCFDYIHIPFDGDWINYSDITPVTDWAKKGGIVSLMWHFNVPKTEQDFKDKNYNNITYNPDETTWNMDNIYVDGTWENQWFYDQMDKVAANILKLQDAGIVALWRPFHEASGNMYNTQGWPKKAWFWWGNNGAEAYKKLWKTMKDYFEAKGIHNLIWIWTGSAKTATNDADTPYYPGDDQVDIVGADCYGMTAAELAQQYNDLSKLYPSKMITLAECGNGIEDKGGHNVVTKTMPKISEMWAAGAKFLYFMPWSDYYYETGASTTNCMFPMDYWTDAMQMQSVTMSNWGKK